MDKTQVDTGEEQAKSGRGGNIPPAQTRFAKGDPRINRLGRPKSFDALRKLAQQISAEALQSGDGEVVTRIEALLRVMSSSKNNADRALFLAYAYGKPAQIIGGSASLEPIKIELIEAYSYDAAVAKIAARSDDDSDN